MSRGRRGERRTRGRETGGCRHAATRLSPSRRCGGSEESRGKAFLDYQNDATADDLTLAAARAIPRIELVKRYTTTGMATDQGKLGNVNAIAILAEATGKSIERVGTTTFRPYYTPVRAGHAGGTFVGHHFQPVRKTPLHEWGAGLRCGLRRNPDCGYASSWFPRQGEDWLAECDPRGA